MIEYSLGKARAATRKVVVLVYYGEDSAAAVQYAKAERAHCNRAMPRDAAMFDGAAERCDRVVIMPGVRKHHRVKLVAAYGDRVLAVAAEPVAHAGQEALTATAAGAEPESEPAADSDNEPGRPASPREYGRRRKAGTLV